VGYASALTTGISPYGLFVGLGLRARPIGHLWVHTAAFSYGGGSEAGDIYKRLRSFEHLAARDGIEGFVVKGRTDLSDQLFLKVKPAAVRDAHRIFSHGDLSAVYEALLADFTAESLADPDFAEEAMLDYLGSHGRNTRWQVQDFLGEKNHASASAD